jgi:hypothetical protein
MRENMCARFYSEALKEKDHRGNLNVDGRLILKHIIKTYDTKIMNLRI